MLTINDPLSLFKIIKLFIDESNQNAFFFNSNDTQRIPANVTIF